MNFPFALVALAVACAAVSVVYALTGSDEPARWTKEASFGFLMMFGGILLLAVVVYAAARAVS